MQSDDIYSFGPEGDYESWQLFFGVPGGFWDVDDYTKPHKMKVVKRCWKMERKCCRKLQEKMRSKDKYPQLFSVAKYCTAAVLDVMKELEGDGCVDSVPSGVGRVKLPVDSIRIGRKEIKIPEFPVPNPKDMAKELEDNGGTSLWIKTDGEK